MKDYVTSFALLTIWVLLGVVPVFIGLKLNNKPVSLRKASVIFVASSTMGPIAGLVGAGMVLDYVINNISDNCVMNCRE